MVYAQGGDGPGRIGRHQFRQEPGERTLLPGVLAHRQHFLELIDEDQQRAAVERRLYGPCVDSFRDRLQCRSQRNSEGGGGLGAGNEAVGTDPFGVAIPKRGQHAAHRDGRLAAARFTQDEERGVRLEMLRVLRHLQLAAEQPVRLRDRQQAAVGEQFVGKHLARLRIEGLEPVDVGEGFSGMQEPRPPVVDDTLDHAALGRPRPQEAADAHAFMKPGVHLCEEGLERRRTGIAGDLVVAGLERFAATRKFWYPVWVHVGLQLRACQTDAGEVIAALIPSRPASIARTRPSDASTV